MTMQIYIIISVAALVAIFLVMFLTNRRKMVKKLTPLAGLAFAFVIAGIVFGDSREVGYALMAIGVLLAFIDMIRKSKKG